MRKHSGAVAARRRQLTMCTIRADLVPHGRLAVVMGGSEARGKLSRDRRLVGRSGAAPRRRSGSPEGSAPTGGGNREVTGSCRLWKRKAGWVSSLGTM